MECEVGGIECSFLRKVEVLGGHTVKCDVCGCSVGMMKILNKKCPLKEG